jgi:hypothetical protein
MKNKLLLFGIMSFFASSVLATTEGLTKEQIQQTIQKNIGSVMKCYEDELTSKPDLKGRVQLAFDIEVDGKILKSSIAKTTLNNQKVESCIVERSKTWIFPKPTGDKSVHVEYPFELRKK